MLKIKLQKQALNDLFHIFFKSILLIFFSIRGYSQEFKRIKNEYFPKNTSFIQKDWWYLTLISGINKRADFHKISGSYPIKSTAQQYFEIGSDYEHLFEKSIAFVIGLHVTTGGRNLIFNVPIDKINPNGYRMPFPLEKFTVFEWGLSAPLSIQNCWHIQSDKNIYVQTGIQFHYSLGSDFDDYSLNLQDSNGRNVEVLNIELNTNNERKPWFTYSFGVGYQSVLKNHNWLRIGLIANLSFTNFVNGSYLIDIPGELLTKGTYKVSGSYYAISLGYGFIRTKKRI